MSDPSRKAEKQPCSPVRTIQALKDTFVKLNESGEQKKKLVILGSTGSIGVQVLQLVDDCPSYLEVVGLTAGSNFKLLAEQIIKYRPKVAAINDESKLDALRALLDADGSTTVKLHCGPEGVVEVAKAKEADTAVTGIVGCAGLMSTIAAIESGKSIALTNKETLVAAGEVVLPLLKKHKVTMIPADSEHSAIFQCLQGSPVDSVNKVILTASGGAFRDWSKGALEYVRLEDALQHPNWSMGAKITIDSATLMNKGLEVIEAHYLFGIDYDDIEVVVHPQSIIHSMVEYKDTSVIAQLGWSDMRIPLLYSISWPHRIGLPYTRLDFLKVGQLTFRAPDTEKYPCLALAYEAGRIGGTMPAALNAANEAAVEEFRSGRIRFVDIPEVVAFVVNAFRSKVKTENITLQDVLDTDAWARSKAREYTPPSPPPLLSFRRTLFHHLTRRRALFVFCALTGLISFATRGARGACMRGRGKP